MRFKEFLRKDEIFDAIDPSMYPYILGGLTAGVGALGGVIGLNRLDKSQKEIEHMKRYSQDLEIKIKKYGPDSEEVQNLLDFIDQHLPVLSSHARHMVDYAREQRGPRDEPTIIKLRSPHGATAPRHSS